MGGSLYMNFAMGSLSEIPATLIGSVLVDKIGRKKTLSGGYIIGGLACLFCVTLTPQSDAQKYTAMLGKFGITAAFSCIFVYAAELFPTVLRSAGMGMSSTAARVGGIAAPLVVTMTVRVFSSMPLLIFGIFGFSAGLVILLCPETLGREPPSTIADCEPITNF